MLPDMGRTQEYDLILNQPTDKDGHVAEIQAGSVDWASSDPAVAEIFEDENDEKKATVKARGVGSYTISASADADLGDGVKMITGQDTGKVVAGEAVNVGFTAGPVREQV